MEKSQKTPPSKEKNKKIRNFRKFDDGVNINCIIKSLSTPLCKENTFQHKKIGISSQVSKEQIPYKKVIYEEAGTSFTVESHYEKQFQEILQTDGL